MDGIHVAQLEPDAAAGALAPSLFRGLAAIHQHQVLAHGPKRGGERDMKAVAIRIQNDKTSYAPSQADGGEDTPLAIEAQSLGGFVQDRAQTGSVTSHSATPPLA